MSEFSIFSMIYIAVLAVLVFCIIPLGIRHYKRLVQQAKAEEELLEKEDELGVSTRFVNIVDVLVMALIIGFAGLGVWNLKPTGDGKTTEQGIIDTDTLLGTLVGQLILIGVVIFIMIWRVNLGSQFGLSLKGKWRALLWCPAILFICWGVTALIMQLGYFQFLEEVYGETPLQDSVVLLQESTDPVLLSLMFLVACIGAPVAEEVLFRGYLFPASKAYLGSLPAILFSGVFFGLIHFNLGALPTLILMGCLLAWAYDRTKTLWVPIIIHLVFNSATVVVQMLSRYYPGLVPEM